MAMDMAQETPIHAGDRVVITHGPDAKQHRGKVWVVETAPAPCPCCGWRGVTLKGHDKIVELDNITRIRPDDPPAAYR